MSERIGAVVQARMGSTRLPGKVLEQVEGHSMLARVVQRLRACEELDTLVVAVPDGVEEAPLIAECRRLEVLVFAGAEHDVLSRYIGAAEEHGIDPVVRITGNCPLLDPRVVDLTVAAYVRRARDGVDLVCNTLPRRFPRGLDTEVVSVSALLRADGLERDAAVREQVTLALYRRPETFRVGGFDAEPDLSHLRWMVDTEEDLAFVREVYRELVESHPLFGLEDVLQLLERRPDLTRLDESGRRKGLSG